MMRVSVFTHNAELSDTYLRRLVALGADALDFGGDEEMPGVREQGYPDLDGTKALRRRLRGFGIDINRVTLPNLSQRFMQNQPGSAAELENVVRALRVYGELGIPLARQRFEGDVFPQRMIRYRSTHRGGYQSRGETLAPEAVQTPTREELGQWWGQFERAFATLVPVAEEYAIKLAVHPSDTPNVDTPFGGLGFHRVIDAFPSAQVGYIYCIGTRAEAGGSALVIDEINNYGRKGKILMVHMRNVRGSLATAGAYEETLLDDGDLNMFKVLLELQKVGFRGYINPDHIPALPGDTADQAIGWGYSIGYVKALLTALVA
ncbi:MAG: mannonate dehydratase [Caldilineaceae bacterium]|nr:mannonate dehydratase [Caldilineaceae bacterium]